MKNNLRLILFFFLINVGANVNAQYQEINSSFLTSEDDPKTFKRTIQLEHPESIKIEEIPQWLETKLNANEHTDFVLENSFMDRIGFTHHKYYQTYKGFRVQDGVFIVHRKQDEIISANGEYYAALELEPKVFLDAQEAIAIGQEIIQAETWAWDRNDFPAPELCIVSTKDGFRLAYKTDIYAYKPLVRQWLFIDAETGEKIAERDQICHLTVPGEAHCFYHGVQTIMVDSIGPSEFLLRDDTRGDGIITRDLNGESDFNLAVDFIDDDNIWDTTTDFDNAALDVHWATGLMYDYMLEAHDWDSYDNQGSEINNYIHHSNSGNAAWTGEGLIFGDGNGIFFNPLTAAEVVGHEFMHAYSSTAVNWNLANFETRTINEAYSDIFSVIVEFNTSPSTANYLLGDMVTVSGIPLRNMEDPNALDHPNTYQGQNWSASNINANSDVLNHCFYLLTQGGTGTNDNGDDYFVNPIALADAADILFRALTVYMTPNTDFPDTRDFGIQACQDLFGPCSEQEIQFTNACYAVGIGDEYSGPPLAEIQFSGDTLVNEDLQFSSNAFTAMSWDWGFGDGSNSMEEMPVHIYESIGTFEVVLSAFYPGGCVMVDTLYVTIADLTDLKDIEFTQVSIYPNPASKKMFVEYSKGQQLKSIRVINTLGQESYISKIERTNEGVCELNLEEMPSGIYFLELEFENSFPVFEKFYLIVN